MSVIITNGKEIKHRVISEFKQARKSIYLAMSWFTDMDIAQELINAKNRNLDVQVVLSSNAQNQNVKRNLRMANIDVHAFETGDPRGNMHHRFCIIDEKKSLKGSYNFTVNASNNNAESILISDDREIREQLFQEFEKLKYNIDHEIGLNQPLETPIETQQSRAVNPLDSFHKQLYDIVYTSAQINIEKYREQGYHTAKKSHGNIDVYKANYDSIRNDIGTLATDDSLGSIKNNLISNITTAYHEKKEEIENEKQHRINSINTDIDIRKKHIEEDLNQLTEENDKLQTGNEITGKKGILNLNRKIDNVNLDIKSLNESFVLKKFWTAGTVLSLMGLLVFTFYLCVFFASAMYKMFFEGNAIRDALERGITPAVPQIVDANAISIIFMEQGGFFGAMATFFFLIPVLLSNLKILGSKNKAINLILFFVGIVIFDVIVAAMVTMQTDEIQSLLIGEVSQMNFWDTYKEPHFWLIFVFGMIPLIIMHFFINQIRDAYLMSRREYVDAEKYRKIKLLEKEKIYLNTELKKLDQKVQINNDKIQRKKEELRKLEIEHNDRKIEIQDAYDHRIQGIKEIFSAYTARVTSGNIFTQEIFDRAIAAFRNGYIDYLPEFYAATEVTNRASEIENYTI